MQIAICIHDHSLSTQVLQVHTANMFLHVADTRPQDSQLHRMTVDSTAVRAVQVGENHLTLIFLKLGMQPADSFVIQLDGIVFFTTDRDRRLNTAEDTPPFKAF